jgi:pimeloyl-ACP methyl ester carboxylesterase
VSNKEIAMTHEKKLAELRIDIHEKAQGLSHAYAGCYGMIPPFIQGIVDYTGFVLKYNPDQPRVPAGNPDGGQWTSGDGGGDGSNNTATILPKISVPNPSGQPVNQANIFVGGFGDHSANRNVADSTSLNKNVYGDNYYATHTDGDEISKLISQLPKGQTVNLIGHSYGADTAADVAVDNPGRVNTLVTIDPVSHFPQDFAAIHDSVNTWVNVNAIGNPDSSTLDSAVGGNPIAYIGGEWGSEPDNFATIPITAPLNHAQFDAMMNTRGPDGRTPVQIPNGH